MYVHFQMYSKFQLTVNRNENFLKDTVVSCPKNLLMTVKIIRKKSERLYILVLHVQPVIESTMLGVCVIAVTKS
jgi:hypothetical protein